ncbi:hypothetical protein ACFQH9_06545 [Pseudonocardia lutea]|uniref:Uncharacterized protein n=1 Tax=Pseudonocardia lutea TaxID=2172015 RepID=A0ABW1I6M7_9PSEU
MTIEDRYLLYRWATGGHVRAAELARCLDGSFVVRVREASPFTVGLADRGAFSDRTRSHIPASAGEPFLRALESAVARAGHWSLTTEPLPDEIPREDHQ